MGYEDIIKGFEFGKLRFPSGPDTTKSTFVAGLEVKGPIQTTGITAAHNWAPSGFLDELPALKGVYLIALKEYAPDAEGIIRNVKLKNTAVTRKYCMANLPSDRVNYYRLESNGQVMIASIGSSVTSTAQYDSEAKNLALGMAKASRTNRIIKIGKATGQGGIAGRISGYDLMSYSITRSAYGSEDSDHLQLFYITNWIADPPGGFTAEQGVNLERDLIEAFRDVYEVFPPWENRLG